MRRERPSYPDGPGEAVITGFIHELADSERRSRRASRHTLRHAGRAAVNNEMSDPVLAPVDGAASSDTRLIEQTQRTFRERDV